MEFKTELHCHTRTVSDCAHITPECTVERYLEKGYTTLVLTEHLSRHTYRQGGRYTGSEDWQEKIDYYMNGYHALQNAAKGRLHILLGCEICLDGSRSDFLIHGMTEDFLRRYPDLMQTNFKTLCQRVHGAGMLIYQAHPFRNNMTVTDPDQIDGIEVYNAHPRHNSRNDFALLWAQTHHLRMLSGSDLHEKEDSFGGGICTDAPITTTEELLDTLRAERYTLIRNGTPGNAQTMKKIRN